MIDRLFGWCQMPDAGDGRVYLAGAVGILMEYPPAVMEAIADPRTGTRVLKDYPTLSDLRGACDEFNGPFVREAERCAAHDNQLRLEPASRLPRTPEQQARIDAQVSDRKMRLIRGGALAETERATRQAPFPAPPGDAPMSSERQARLLADLAERKARNEAQRTQPAAAPPDTTINNVHGEIASVDLQQGDRQDELRHEPMRGDPSTTSESFGAPQELIAANQSDAQ